MIRCEHCKGEHDIGQRFCSVTGKLFAAERFFPPGMILDGKYRLGALIGAGGMGAVIEGTHILLEKRVAIKLLLPDFADNAEMSARLLREARTASATGHRNITMVTDLGRTTEGTLYIVMERLVGRSLETVLHEDGRLPLPRAAGIVRDILSGLEAVHRRGIVHRDLKPSNVMLCTEEDGGETVKILDFGISKQIGVSDLTTMGKVLGTPRYMPPEQARGLSDIDHRADIYAAGAILYTLLTGKPPIGGTNYNAVLAAILDGKVLPPSSKVPGIPAAVDGIVMRAMASAREQRYPDAQSFRKEISRYCKAVEPATQLGLGQGMDDSYDEMAAPGVPEAANLELIALDEREAAGAPRATSPPPSSKDAGRPAPRPAPERSIEAAAPPTQVQRPAPQPGLPPRLAGPPADLRPGAPGLLPEFELRDEEPPLELSIPRPAAPRPLPPPPAIRRRPPWRLLRGLLIAVLAVAGAGAAWVYRWELRGLLTGSAASNPEQQVMVLVETEPKDAEIFVDGVFQTSGSVSLPKSENRVYTIRVQAKGHVTEERELIPDRTQVVRIALRPRVR